jgi:hypothetical protein
MHKGSLAPSRCAELIGIVSFIRPFTPEEVCRQQRKQGHRKPTLAPADDQNVGNLPAPDVRGQTHGLTTDASLAVMRTWYVTTERHMAEINCNIPMLLDESPLLEGRLYRYRYH